MDFLKIFPGRMNSFSQKISNLIKVRPPLVIKNEMAQFMKHAFSPKW